MKDNQFYLANIETLLLYTENEESLNKFFNGDNSEKIKWQVATEFIYRCIKCSLLSKIQKKFHFAKKIILNQLKILPST